ncbi:hypothetical protein [Actinosynnema sp. NPDC020468]|uniref:hypothetical protein n=1 Tax=Actinosynnema sp. NPDC020468 TaxID=3154488 RepID=UPI003404DAE3
MTVDWSALGVVSGVSLAVVLGLVVLFATGLRAWSARESGGSVAAATALAVGCFGACAALVLFGIHLIVAR